MSKSTGTSNSSGSSARSALSRAISSRTSVCWETAIRLPSARVLTSTR